MSLQTILKDCGLNIIRQEPVHGGDINSAYCLYSPNERYFLKVNDAARYPAMFEKEAWGLEVLRKGIKSSIDRGSILIPKVNRQGVVGNTQYLLLEWIEPGRPGKEFWENFGTATAAMHHQPQEFFGWEEDNYIGSLVQKNTSHESWASFFSECRIRPLVKMLFDNGAFTKEDLAAAEIFCSKSSELFPEEPAALLHGDLWSGNFMVSSNGIAAIYDPAVYYGHREMDIGMTKLFGGFDERFYAAYDAGYPLEKNWRERIKLTQLYPLLVHAVLFGGHYPSSARNLIRQF